jgi:hypothetical protein
MKIRTLEQLKEYAATKNPSLVVDNPRARVYEVTNNSNGTTGVFCTIQEAYSAIYYDNI